MRALRLLSILGLAFLAMGGFAEAGDFRLAPFKDKLFRYPKVIEKELDGRYIAVAYDKKRDIYKRDKIPLRRAKAQYVNEWVKFRRRPTSYRTKNGTHKMFAIGRRHGGAKVVTIFLHGAHGNRSLGVNDWSFGGNFNRIQNLMWKNKGLYLTPEFSDFKEKGTDDIAALIRQVRKRNPGAPVFLACGSMGGGICWRLAKDPERSALIDGMLVLGSHWHDDFLKSATAKKGGRPVPIYIGHGSWDPTFKGEVQKDFFEKIVRQNPDYPIRFVMFDTGKHGTPIRMVDWRRELNWMLSLS